MFSSRPIIKKDEIISKISEADILGYYLGINKIPILINSPLRQDNSASFALYSPDGIKVNYKDFGTNEGGSCMTLLGKLWNCSRSKVYSKLQNDLLNFDTKTVVTPKQTIKKVQYGGTTELQVKTRDWRDYDIEYWNSYGITLEWCKYLNIIPISHKFIYKNDQKMVFRADKYAYAFFEFKDDKTYIKVYQPYNKQGFKWQSAMNKSVWSLWTKIPKTGNNLIISSSVKDCANIMCNLNIPAISLQGEGYLPKQHVMNELKQRFKNIIVFYDNDFKSEVNTGREDSIKLCKKFNLKRIEIPEQYECKDPSDLYKKYGKQKYLEILIPILKRVIIH